MFTANILVDCLLEESHYYYKLEILGLYFPYLDNTVVIIGIKPRSVDNLRPRISFVGTQFLKYIKTFVFI